MAESSSYRGKPRTATGGEPVRVPRKKAHDSEEREPDGPFVEIPDPIVVADLAALLKLKPFVLIGELMHLKLFASATTRVGYHTAATVARKCGFRPRRPA
jgi:hypothetical protein